MRGAVQVDRDEERLILDASERLVGEVLRRNRVTAADLVAMIFTMTPDLTSCFPAAAARRFGLTDVPLLCAGEIPVATAPPRVVRLMALLRTDRPRSAITHVYLDGAAVLRPDLAQPDAAGSGPRG